MKPYRFLTFNLRVDVESDGINRWLHRMQHVFAFLKKKKYDFIGFQEVTPLMYEDLKNHLDAYDYFGDYRYYLDESTPIFYRRDHMELLESKTFWLTETPDEISILDGSAYFRVCTYGVFKKKDDIIVFFNTHLDYMTDDVSLKQAHIILNKINHLKNTYPLAKIVLCGDFNQKVGSKTINLVQSHLKMVDIGSFSTYHGFSSRTDGDPVDFFFYDNIERIKAKVILEQPKNVYLSDHYPIELKIK
ncbi:MAG: endonuclease/exonuclease/phosphatase family protein [Acholeplasmataceae bacterium]|nr:endonuclease/exonuclease/phosphatase family protein [Acholeplasmataceae bacterium]